MAVAGLAASLTEVVGKGALKQQTQCGNLRQCHSHRSFHHWANSAAAAAAAAAA
eukprot:CAMPEP_0172889078 /NCGR_PEP_ID=MMETSP1075-20121228/137979_1 /TAXON_ID=2916 /ORGANISM="Ceratium fusus, Strain PA161109" /LENGTH=53 /DNA_ID=CAMNT_0013743059 /DNA_START=40 /DNA_END=198 /DNA_ORIENTATION=+